jgi:hypothetical protein
MITPRTILCILLAVAYAGWRYAPAVVPVVAPAAVTFPEVASAAARMSREDRAALAEAYQILSRSVANNPASEPVFNSTADVRKGHRAAMLVVWKGVLQNREGEVPGLREALEGAVDGRIGDSDVPLNPSLQATAAQAFADVASSLR